MDSCAYCRGTLIYYNFINESNQVNFIVGFGVLFVQGQAQVQPALKAIFMIRMTRQPLSGAIVSGDDGRELVRSDLKGYFSLDVLSAVELLKVSLKGYKTQLVKIGSAVREPGNDAGKGIES